MRGLKAVGVVAFGLAFAAGIAAHAAGANGAAYAVKTTWKLGGDGSWDYLTVDASSHLLYIARLTRVMVVDMATGALKAEIGGLEHAHGVVLDADGKTGYITDGGSGKVVVFDRASFKATGAIAAGKNPDSLVIEPRSGRLFVFNGASKDATVIDLKTRAVVGTIAMPGKPEFSATEDGNVFVNIEDTSQVLRIDGASMKVTARWPLAPCESPSGLTLDAAHHRLFSVCDNRKMAVLDSTSGHVVAMVPVGEGPDAVLYDAAHGLVFTPNGESGTMSVVRQTSPDAYTVEQTLATKVGARTAAIDPGSGTVYTVSASLGKTPPKTVATPRPRPPVLPDSFVVLVVARQ